MRKSEKRVAGRSSGFSGSVLGLCVAMRISYLSLFVLSGFHLFGMAGAQGNDPENIWSFQSLMEVEVPNISDDEWSGSVIDRLVKNKLDKSGLKPVNIAEDLTLLRRIYFDLIGLPPTVEEIESFLSGKEPDPFERVIEDLLGRPQYGERWGRHWLDVVRYADTAGDNSDFPIPQAYRYRNYVIDAFNDDMPFDQFIKEQLAGDLVNDREGIVQPLTGIPRNWDRRPVKLRNVEEVSEHSIELKEVQLRRYIATGYLAQSRRFGSEVARYPHELTIEDTIDNLGKAFLGLSIACARCHDHKFDAISIEDYYALYGIFNSTRYSWPGIELAPQPRDMIPLMGRKEYMEEYGRVLEYLRPKSDKLLECWEAYDEAWKKHKAEPDSHVLERAWWETNKAHWEAASQEGKALIENMEVIDDTYGVVDSDDISDEPVHLKGSNEKLGEIVPRGFLSVLGGQTVPEDEKSEVSGRLHLAEWLTDAESVSGQLVARVMVNRIWQHHFGAGIVKTPNDFGVRGSMPTHPDLLDYLAKRFIESGWSVKAMHREIMATRVYRLSSYGGTDQAASDPENILLWRQNRNRLEAEAIYDSLNYLSGRLKLEKMEDAHPFPEAVNWKFTQHHPFNDEYTNEYRGVYQMIKRMKRHSFFSIFDGADPNATTPERTQSVTTPQALYMMNNEHFHFVARNIAMQIIEKSSDHNERVRVAFAKLYCRFPEDYEIEASKKFVGGLINDIGTKNVGGGNAEESAWVSFIRALLRANEFVYVD